MLAGERAHYELAAGRPDVAEALLRVMEGSTAGASRLIPEQVWDAPDIPELELFTGKPSGSACPLVWAHAEYVKLRRSLRDGSIFDQPPQTVQRYSPSPLIRGVHVLLPFRIIEFLRAAAHYHIVARVRAVVEFGADQRQIDGGHRRHIFEVEHR